MRIVCIGDSLTYGYGVTRAAVWPALVSQIWQETEVINRGINGDMTNGMLARFEKEVLQEYPDIVFVMGGSNDIFFSRDIVSAKNNIAAMVFRCMHKNIEVILGIPLPVYEDGLVSEWQPYASGEDVQHLLTEYQNWLSEWGESFGIKIIDFRECISEDNRMRSKLYLDGIHLNEIGHKFMAEFFVNKLMKITK